MVFSSFPFILLFLPLTLAGFWGFSRIGPDAAKRFLCLASLVFYAWWNPAWLPVLLISIVGNYAAGYGIVTRVRRGATPRGLLAIAIALNLAALAYYKYLFAVLQAFPAFQFMAAAPGLPIGISFFTFTQIAFLVDASQGFEGEYRFWDYLLFVTFFPHLIAGPIVHHRDLMPQFEDPRNFRLHVRDIAIGLAIFAMGLAKKAAIADRLSETSGRLIDSGHVGLTASWVGALSYSMQLYFDFSGYSDMAIGLARMFGIKFPINFLSPYKSTSIIDFWQRWHITLTRFLTSYLYNPLALALVRRRARRGRITTKRTSATIAGFIELIALPTIVTMILAGIWHGAGLQFVIFGLLHGLYLAVNHAWRTFGPQRQEAATAPWPWRLAAMALVYLSVLVAQIFFHSTDVGHALLILEDMAGLTPAATTARISTMQFVSASDFGLLALAMGIGWLAPSSLQITRHFDPALMLGRKLEPTRFGARLTIGWALAVGAVLAIGLQGIRDGQPFIYFQF